MFWEKINHDPCFQRQKSCSFTSGTILQRISRRIKKCSYLIQDKAVAHTEHFSVAAQRRYVWQIDKFLVNAGFCNNCCGQGHDGLQNIILLISKLFTLYENRKNELCSFVYLHIYYTEFISVFHTRLFCLHNLLVKCITHI